MANLNENLLIHYQLCDSGMPHVNKIEEDVSGHQINGKKVGDFTFAPKSARYEESLVFTTNNYILTEYDFDLEDYSITFWVKPEELKEMEICSFDKIISFFLKVSNDELYLSIDGASLEDEVNVPLDEWTHISIIRKDGILSIYKNNILAYVGTSFVEMISNSLSIGHDFIGSITDFRIYEDALSEEQTRNLCFVGASICKDKVSAFKIIEADEKTYKVHKNGTLISSYLNSMELEEM